MVVQSHSDATCLRDHWDGEEPFHSAGMEIDGDYALQSTSLEQVGDETGADRLSPTGAPVLTRIAEVQDTAVNGYLDTGRLPGRWPDGFHLAFVLYPDGEARKGRFLEEGVA